MAAIKERLHVVAPSKRHTHTVILLHGRGSTASEFASELFESQASDDLILPETFPFIRWVFPSSKLRNSARFETTLSQWFDMWSVDHPSERCEGQGAGLKESISEIIEVVRSEASLLGGLERVILGGVSQGCATAIHALICGGTQIGGFIGISSWLPFQEPIENICSQSINPTARIQAIRALFFDPSAGNFPTAIDLSNDSNPFSTLGFLSHSKDDDVVPIINGERLRQGLKTLSMAVTWKEYEDGGHWVNEPQGVDDLVDFIKDAFRLPKDQHCHGPTP